ncbi:MAG: glycine cleavage system protein T [Acidiferrobacteraceae bacterium]|nr:glycine cleavage system protein T [Acidiferrobacteraceae bacterium]
MQSHARVVIVGGGCVGVNILYSLAHRGWSDICLLERTELTAGSTWHAAGLIPLYSFSYRFGRIISKTIEIYEQLEAETGQSVSWHKCGQLRVAESRDRMDEYLNYASIAPTQGVRAEILTPAETIELWPLMKKSSSLVGSVYNPDDGHIAPADVTQALAKGATQLNARIYKNTEATSIDLLDTGEWRVQTNKGDIICEHVVTATGNYAQQTAHMLELDLPCFPVLHQYWVTDSVPQIKQRRTQGCIELPILRNERINGYIREERDSLMFGPYERPERLEHFARNGVPPWFGADLMPENIEAVQENWEAAIELVPILGDVGIRTNVRGPICGTPDNLPLCGPAWGKKNLWLAEGFTGGILMGGGLGLELANWIVDGEPHVDLSEVDPRRFGDYANKTYTGIKNKEAFGNNFGIHYPGYEWPAARPAKSTPSYERLTQDGAVWGAVYGWEIPLWFAPTDEKPHDIWSYRKFNSMVHVGKECRAVRQTAGLFEMTPMTKFEVRGSGAERWLNSILANKMPATIGGIRLAHLLTEKGTVRSEFTVTRLAADLFYLIGTPRGERHDFDTLSKYLPRNGNVHLQNVTLERGGLALVGPNARAILQALVEVDLSTDEFPWLTSQTLTVGLASDVRALRINYEGELGWELYHPIPYNQHIMSELIRVGENYGLKNCGYRAIESLRLEKSYRAIYRDLDTEHTALEAGLDRFIQWDKEHFVGKTSLVGQKNQGLSKRMVTLQVETIDADAYMNESIYKDGCLVGRITSGATSHNIGKCISMAYVDIEVADVGTNLEVQILENRCHATIVADSPYDPLNEKPRQ